MAKETEAPTAWTPNQVVAYRVATARRLRGWTQEQAATALAPYLGTKLSPASFSAIERSYLGGRIRRFNADEILALSRGFDLPIGWFFTPPPIGDGIHIATPDSPPDGYDPTLMVNAILGLAENLPHWDEALRKWWDGPSELSSPLDPAGHFVHFRAQVPSRGAVRRHRSSPGGARTHARVARHHRSHTPSGGGPAGTR